jgi:hypothetical protein
MRSEVCLTHSLFEMGTPSGENYRHPREEKATTRIHGIQMPYIYKQYDSLYAVLAAWDVEVQK